MRVLPLVAALPMFAAACGGDGGSVVSVFPEQAFVGRTTTVEVTGVDTDWSSGVTVDFGTGVTVNAITVVSPTALQAEIDVAANVALGAADVSVSGTDTGPGLLEFLSPVSVEVSTFEQGGFGSIIVTNLDLLHPFDLTTDEQTGEFINLDVTSAIEGVDLVVADATADTIVLSALIDVSATETGEITLSASDGTTPNTTLISSVPVVARTPVPLTANTPVDFTVLANGNLFEITGAELAMLQLQLDVDPNAAFQQRFVILPASGKFSELLMVHSGLAIFGQVTIFDNRIINSGEKLYVVAFDGGSDGYTATLTPTAIPLTGITPVADGNNNDTAATAQVANGSVVQFDGILADVNDVDCFSVTTTAANQRIHVYTTDEDGQSDTVVTIFDINDVTQLEPAEDSADADFGEEVLTNTLTAPGSRSVCISASEFSPEGFTNAPYTAVVRIE